MPNRILRDSITESESLSRLTAEEERFFYRLLSKADDYGRFDARPPILRASCFKLMLARITDAEVEAWLSRLADPDIAVVQLYEVGGRPYGVFSNWHLYQRLARARQSKYPEPPEDIGPPDSDNIIPQILTPLNICKKMLDCAPVNGDENGGEIVNVGVVVCGDEDDTGVVNVNGTRVGDEDLNGSSCSPVPTKQTSSSFLDRLISAYEANIGKVRPGMRIKMSEFEANWHPPPEYGEYAVAEAVDRDKRKWSYVAGILKNWCTERERTNQGGNPGKRAKPPKLPGGDPNRYISEYVRRRGSLPEARDSPTTKGEVIDTR